MPDLQALFDSGRIVDIILLLVLAEAALLLALRRRTGTGPGAPEILANLAAGAALMLAVRSALVEAPWTVTAAWLVVALIAHSADMAARWR